MGLTASIKLTLVAGRRPTHRAAGSFGTTRGRFLDFIAAAQPAPGEP
jgi:hypothetical protein